MAYGYVPQTRNLVRNLAATAFIVSSGPSDTTRLRLRDGFLDRRFVCTSASSPVTITVDLGSAQTVNTAAALNHNLQFIGSGTKAIEVRGADDASITVGVVGPYTATVGASNLRGKDTALAFANVSKRYWRFSFTFTGSGVLQVGELVLGVATTLARGELDGSGLARRYSSPQVSLANGGVRAINLTGGVLERVLRFEDFSPSEMLFFSSLMEDSRGAAVPVLWCEDWAQVASAVNDSQQACIYGNVLTPGYEETFTNFRLSRPGDLIIRSQGREVGA